MRLKPQMPLLSAPVQECLPLQGCVMMGNGLKDTFQIFIKSMESRICTPAVFTPTTL